MLIQRYKKYWARRKRLAKAWMFSASNIFAYLGLLAFAGCFFYQLVILHKPLQDKGDIKMPLLIMAIFITLSGLAIVWEKRTVDSTHLRVVRGKEAIMSGIQLAVFGVFMALLIFFMM